MLTASSHQSNTQLIEQAKNGSLEAFDCLVEDYQDAVFDLAYAILGNFHEAEDVAQEAFIQAWRSLKQLRDDEKFFGWLYRITQNLCKNFITRSRQRTQRTVPLQLIAHSLQDSKTTSETTSNIRESVFQAINSLSQGNRLAVVLYYISGYSVEEVASLLRVPSGTVRRRLHESRKQLKLQLLEELKGDLHERRPSRDKGFATVVAIINASRSGDVQRVKAILKSHPSSVNARDARGWMPLHYAARHGHREVAQALLDYSADPNAKDLTWGWTPLHLAVDNNHKEVEQVLVAAGARLNLIGASALGKVDDLDNILKSNSGALNNWGSGSGPLHWAASYGQEEIARLLLARGADVNARSNNVFANTPLHCAVLTGHTRVARLLIEHGARFDMLDAHGATPLHMLVKYPRHLDIAEAEKLIDLLLSSGASIDGQNAAGETPLHWAATRGDHRVAELLLSRGAHLDIYAAAGLGRADVVAQLLNAEPQLINRRGPGGMTPVHFAAYGNGVDTARLLCERGADLAATGAWFGGTPLHIAAYAGHPEMVELLIGAGANVNASDADGWAPLHQFRLWWLTDLQGERRTQVARLLLDAGADVNARNNDGETPLHLAAHHSELGLASTLVAHGAGPNVADGAGRTALHRATMQANNALVQLLLSINRAS